MSRTSKCNIDLRSNYLEVVIESTEKGAGPSRTLDACVPTGTAPNLEALLTDSNLIELVPLTPAELADYLGVKLKLVEEWVRTGEVTTVEYGGSMRIPFWEFERRATAAGRGKKTGGDARNAGSRYGIDPRGSARGERLPRWAPYLCNARTSGFNEVSLCEVGDGDDAEMRSSSLMPFGNCDLSPSPHG